MNALDHLAALLVPAMQEGGKAMRQCVEIDTVLSALRARAKGANGNVVPEDLQLQAVRDYWERRRIENFREAYLLSSSLCIPHRPDGPCILEDRSRLTGVLDGADGYRDRPNAYRRCYQGLARSYFSYDAKPAKGKATGTDNWHLLRDYLHDRNRCIRGPLVDPDWVETALTHRALFGPKPCEPYVDVLLNGDAAIIQRISQDLNIGQASWFHRELILAQVTRAIEMEDRDFLALLPRLLSIVTQNEILRDAGLRTLLDRYAEVPGMPVHIGLRDQTVQWWGNPWLPSTETRWQGVAPEAKTMVTDWLKDEIIETFFMKLAEDGQGDRRRMDFWRGYSKAIDHMEFALGSFARHSLEPDFVALRKKMTGLICTLDASGANNAFIMRMGNLVVVEFSEMGALYGYDARKGVPFDTRKPVRLPLYEPNSLKQKSNAVLWLKHQDVSSGSWEENFAALLRRDFGITPNPRPAPTTRSRRAGTSRDGPANAQAQAQSTLASSAAYSRSSLTEFARLKGLRVEDLSKVGGNLWVRADMDDPEVVTRLSDWGFRHRANKGWWK
ncbi:MAG: EH signature domain-containing protein [Janthinobacterium lividum]